MGWALTTHMHVGREEHTAQTRLTWVVPGEHDGGLAGSENPLWGVCLPSLPEAIFINTGGPGHLSEESKAIFNWQEIPAGINSRPVGR